jgi:multidrug efflux pump subunit AcrB
MSGPTPPATGGPRRRGGIDLMGLFVRHRTAANLLMVLMILVGALSLHRINVQFFPDFGLDFVTVGVEWRGASAEDVDANVVQAIEPEVRFLDGVKHVNSTASEGRAQIAIEFHPGSDMQAALSNVETAIGQVTTLPEDSETPEVRRILRYEPISRVVVSGPYSETALKAIAKRMRDDLLDLGIDKITLLGARDEEIWVEIRPEKLLELDLTLDEISRRIRATSQDLPAGGTAGAYERQIRSIGLETDAAGVGRIEVRSLPSGQKILLRDVARVTERFDEDMPEVRYEGYRAIELNIQRSLNADALELADIVNAYLEEVAPSLPSALKVEQYRIQANLIRDRINLLLKNGVTGLVLVVLVLFVFLNASVAFWVAMGIPVSLLATVAVMLATGQTINMVSLFGMIMALGIIVDDAIVVGEHAEGHFRRGLDPLAAAEMGARRMAPPVFSSSLTTIAAFTPLLMISDIIGSIIVGIPYVVIAVIVASLIECFFALPGHLRGAFAMSTGRQFRFRVWFNGHFNAFRDGPFQRFVEMAVAWRYAALAMALGLLIMSVGLLVGGRVKFDFFPSPEADVVYANVQMAPGTPRSQTLDMVRELRRSMDQVEHRLTGGEGGLVRVAVDVIAMSAGRSDGLAVPGGDNLAGITVELAPSDERTIRTSVFADAWREAVKPIAGLESMTILAARGGPPGRSVDVRLSGDDLASLKSAARVLRSMLSRYEGVSGIEDDLSYGKLEAIMEVTPQGRALGFTTESVGRQIRNAFEGAIARRFARGDEEVTVRVRYPRDVVDTGLFETTYLRAANGMEVPLREVVNFRNEQGFASVKREDGRRQVAVTAELDKGITSTGEVIAALKREGVFEEMGRFGVKVSFAGKAEEQRQTISDMKLGAAFGLGAIFIILAWVFGSYMRPFVVMAIIPLSFVGAMIGHWALGYNLTILSLIALVGLAGIVVNDSIILVTTIDGRIRNGESLHQAIVDGTRDRLRAVILTSLTTIGGLTPLLFERSFQAQFLIPMAITLVFGLMATTLLVLLVIPALIAVQGDISRFFHWLWSSESKAPAE